MIDHINAAIEELESAKDLLKESYIGTCTTSYDRLKIEFKDWDSTVKTKTQFNLIIEDDGDPRLLKALHRLEGQIAILQSMVAKMQKAGAIDRQHQYN